MSKVPEDKGISMYGGRYLPLKVQTEVKVKSYDSYENKLVLGFLSEVVGATRRLREHHSALGSQEGLEKILEASHKKGEFIPTLANIALVRCAPSRKNDSLQKDNFLQKIDKLIAQGSELLHSYTSFLSDVDGYFTRTPHRTKIFQEVQAYSQSLTFCVSG